MEKVTLKNWGNSMGIRIPKSILQELDLNVDDILNISVCDDSIVLRKSFRHKSFEERLAEYDGQITTIDFDWGNPVGGELF